MFVISRDIGVDKHSLAGFQFYFDYNSWRAQPEKETDTHTEHTWTQNSTYSPLNSLNDEMLRRDKPNSTVQTKTIDVFFMCVYSSQCDAINSNHNGTLRRRPIFESSNEWLNWLLALWIILNMMMMMMMIGEMFAPESNWKVKYIQLALRFCEAFRKTNG